MHKSHLKIKSVVETKLVAEIVRVKSIAGQIRNV